MLAVVMQEQVEARANEMAETFRQKQQAELKAVQDKLKRERSTYVEHKSCAQKCNSRGAPMSSLRLTRRRPLHHIEGFRAWLECVPCGKGLIGP